MAPIARNRAPAFTQNSGNFLRSQDLREGSWDFTGSEQHSEGSRAESEEPASYDAEDFEYENEDSSELLLVYLP
jgi:hypothetical protein